MKIELKLWNKILGKKMQQSMKRAILPNHVEFTPKQKRWVSIQK